jgi:phosphonoacetaldehyde hydrolase
VIKGIIFDWAGTTVDFGCQAPAGAFVAAFAELGLTVSLEEARRPMGLHKKDHIRAMLQTREIADRWQAHQGRPWTEADVTRLYEIVTPMQLAAVGQHSQLIPETLACMAELRARGLKIGASTGYFQVAADRMYAEAARQGFTPDFSICADEVPAGRPAPWMLFRAMEALNLFPPSSVIKVGDTLVDVQDGHNAGVWSVAVLDSSNEMGLSLQDWQALTADEQRSRRIASAERLRPAHPHAMIPTLASLPQLVDVINGMLATRQSPTSVKAEMLDLE